MIVGYARISDKSQNIRSQVDQLKQYGCDKIVEETITGIAEDKALNALVEDLQDGDTLVAVRTDRIARSAIQVLLLASKLEKMNVNLVLLDLGVDTRTPAGKLIIGVMASLGQWERENLKEKQRRGIEAARERGVHLGRKPTFSKLKIKSAIEDYREKRLTVAEICDKYGISKSSLYRHIKEFDGK